MTNKATTTIRPANIASDDSEKMVDQVTDLLQAANANGLDVPAILRMVAGHLATECGIHPEPVLVCDHAHAENVGPLLTAIEYAGVSLAPFATGTALGDTTHDEWWDIAKKASLVANRPASAVLADIQFALGYLQATSSLTGALSRDQFQRCR